MMWSKARRRYDVHPICHFGVLLDSSGQHALTPGENAYLPLHHSGLGFMRPLSAVGDPHAASYSADLEM